MDRLSRRAFVTGASALALTGCVSEPRPELVAEGPREPRRYAVADLDPIYAEMYGPLPAERFPVEATDLSRIDPAFLRDVVAYSGREPSGTIVVDPARRYLFLVQESGRAIRYGVGVGREGFAWSGTATVNSKQEWPDWYPTKEMMDRRPDLADIVSPLRSGLGVPGGADNPLGARAMYLWQGNRDTLFRIHGTPEPWTIGQNVSSGCIRMINQDAIDLYQRVPVGTKVVVLGGAGARTS
jgi:lipoprotein-anchoring transpeptidase ErfK/SrfK